MKLEWFVIEARNCCPIEECHELCTIIGNFTMLGWITIISFVIILAIFIRMLNNKLNDEGKKNECR